MRAAALVVLMFLQTIQAFSFHENLPCPPHCASGVCHEGDIPAECLQPSGKCDFYNNCLYRSQPCPEIQNIMGAKCYEYQVLESKLTTVGQQWSRDIRACLQHKIADLVLKPRGSQFTCTQAKEVFFGQHVDCYLHGSCVSFCQLPLLDTLRIYQHAAGILFSSYFWDVAKSAAELKIRCATEFYEIALTGTQGDLTAPTFFESADFSESIFSESAVHEEIQKAAATLGWEFAVSRISSEQGAITSHVVFRHNPNVPSAPQVTDEQVKQLLGGILTRDLIPSGIGFMLNNTEIPISSSH